VASDGEVRIGVFICDCGKKIADVVDVEELEQQAARLPGVCVARREAYGCSKVGLRDIKGAVSEHSLNRVVVAGCTPRTHERLFRTALEGAGLSGSQFEMVNIREQCAYVHVEETARATRKAVDLVRMGVAKAALLQPQRKVEVEVTPSALVIGGGIAGLTAALAVARGGFRVTLVEREEELGGQVARLHVLYPTGESAKEFIEQRIRAVRQETNIEVLTRAVVRDVGGSLGDYRVAVEQDGRALRLDVGAVIIAVGAQEARPAGVPDGDGAHVITQLELEQGLEEGREQGHRVVMILEGVDQAYYSTASAAAALKNCLLIKRANPATEVSLCFADLDAGLSRGELEEARESGIRFVKFGGQQPPVITAEAVEVFDQLRAEQVSLPHDLVVLALPQVPQDGARALARKLRIPVDDRGFLLEPDARLRPGTYVPEGVFVCGSAHYPSDVQESVFQGYRAAARAQRHLLKGRIVSQGPPARVDETLCVGCGTCVESCPFQAISMVDRDGALSVSSIDESLCKGCGNCAVVCPAKAITVEPYTDKELVAQIEAALASRSDSELRTIGLMCEWSGYAAADLAGAEGRQYPPQMRIIRLGCSARFDPYLVLWAFLRGADGVLLGACDPGVCHYVEGNERAEARVEALRTMLKGAGFDPRRLRLEWLRPDDAEKFARAVERFTDEIEYLGSAGIR
jgi:heterodisulfide reductase subunit A